MGRILKRKVKGKQNNTLQQDPQDVALAASISPSVVHSPVDSGGEDATFWLGLSPSSPKHPKKLLSKKTKRDGTGKHMASNSESILDVLAAICELSVKHDATFQNISTIEKTTQQGRAQAMAKAKVARATARLPSSSQSAPPRKWINNSEFKQLQNFM